LSRRSKTRDSHARFLASLAKTTWPLAKQPKYAKYAQSTVRKNRSPLFLRFVRYRPPEMFDASTLEGTSAILIQTVGLPCTSLCTFVVDRPIGHCVGTEVSKYWQQTLLIQAFLFLESQLDIRPVGVREPWKEQPDFGVDPNCTQTNVGDTMG
jgi:hypothetical protein